jgi:hypothetical protein
VRYKVYHDEDSRTIVISNVPQVIAEGTLDAVFSGADKITIRHRAADWALLGPVNFARIVREDGTGFNSVAECLQYLEDELNKRHESTESDWTETNW